MMDAIHPGGLTVLKSVFSSCLLLLASLLITTCSGTSAGKTSYTVMVYMCGSDLESENGAATADIEEMLKIGSTTNLHVVIQTGGASEWKNDQVKADKTQRWLVEKDSLRMLAELEPVSMGQSKSLSDFITWAAASYPADRYILIMWNHGAGSVDGYGADELFDNALLDLKGIDQALASATSTAKIRFEMIGFDTCLMANVETASIAARYADWFVASEELEPGHGWNYTPVLASLVTNAALDGDVLGRIIVDTYRDQAASEGTDGAITLSVVNLKKIPALVSAIDAFASSVQLDGEIPLHLARARNKAEDYGNDRANNSFTDMVDLSDLVKQLAREESFGKAAAIDEALKEAVVYRIGSESTPVAAGLSIFFPFRDRDSFAERVKKYATNPFPESWKKLVTDYSGLMLADTSGIEFDKGEPEEIDEDETNYVSRSGKKNTTKGKVYRAGIDSKDFAQLASIYMVLGRMDRQNPDKFVMLGIDSDVYLTNGKVSSDFEGEWVTLDGNFVSMYEEDENDEGYVYSIPAKINGKTVDIVVTVDKKDGNYKIQGASEGVDPKTGIPSKQFFRLKKGDRVTPLFATFNIKTDKDGFDEGTAFVYDEGRLDLKKLPAGEYLIGFLATDMAQNDSMSDFKTVEVH